MVTCFELLSTELFYELFDYLPSDEILYAFIGLNNRLNKIVNSYSLQIDFRRISRTKFDFVCQHLQPKQVMSLIFSKEDIPNQVQLFHQNFPHFQNQFIHLKSVVFIRTETILLDLPHSVLRLSFKCDNSDLYPVIKQTLIRHANFLTHITVNNANIFQSINTSFPELTHLVVVGNRSSDVTKVNSLSPFDLNSTIQKLYSSITHLHIFITKNDFKSDNFEYLSYCLTHLSLVLIKDMNISFACLTDYLIKFNQITHLNIEGTNELDLMNGLQWEKFISKTRIIKFSFRFLFGELEFNPADKINLLESFRSSFWLKEKHWYVAIRNDSRFGYICIYSLPRFRSTSVGYPTDDYPPLSTAPLDIIKRVFYNSKIDFLSCILHDSIILPTFRFTQVSELSLEGSHRNTINCIFSIIDLNQIRKLDVSRMKDFPITTVNELLTHTSRLHHLVLKRFDPLLILPTHIRFLTLNESIQLDDIDEFCSILSCIETVKLTVDSTMMMIELINRIEYLHNIIFCLPMFNSLSDITPEWFHQNSHQMKTKHFTYQFTDTLFPDIHVSFSNK